MLELLRACDVYWRTWKIVHAVGTAGDALCVEMLKIVLYVLEVLKACAVCHSV